MAGSIATPDNEIIFDSGMDDEMASARSASWARGCRACRGGARPDARDASKCMAMNFIASGAGSGCEK